MDHLLGALAELLFSFVFVGTGKVVVILVSLGRWRCESIFGNEGSLHGAAGALSFVRDGQRVVTTTGMGTAGFIFYLLLAAALVAMASR